MLPQDGSSVTGPTSGLTLRAHPVEKSSLVSTIFVGTCSTFVSTYITITIEFLNLRFFFFTIIKITCAAIRKSDGEMGRPLEILDRGAVPPNKDYELVVL